MVENRNKSIRTLIQTAVILLSFVQLFPLYIVVINVFKEKSTNTTILGFPKNFTLENINYVLFNTNFFSALLNSLFVTSVSILILLFIGSMAAYPIARIQSKMSKIVGFYFLLGLMLPLQFAMIPLFQLVRDLHLMNKYSALILVQIAYNLPISVFVFSSFIRDIPQELEKAAQIDGCTTFSTFWRIIFPLLSPAMVVVIISNLLVIWNDFLSPLLLISDNAKQTITVMILSFQGQYGSDITSMFTAIILASLPLVLLYIFLQRYFYKGITEGAIK
jgi:raffinose/stachyose/melibiose transport system permease protein